MGANTGKNKLHYYHHLHPTTNITAQFYMIHIYNMIMMKNVEYDLICLLICIIIIQLVKALKAGKLDLNQVNWCCS